MIFTDNYVQGLEIHTHIHRQLCPRSRNQAPASASIFISNDHKY